MLSATPADSQCGSAQDVNPFHYRHLGSFAFIGADNAVLEMPLNQTKPSAFTGFLTGLLWKGMESYEQISLKVRKHIAFCTAAGTARAACRTISLLWISMQL